MVFLRARPVVKMMASVSFLSDQKQVVLEEQNCTLKDGTRVACLSLKMCLEYSGLGVDPRLGKYFTMLIIKFTYSYLTMLSKVWLFFKFFGWHSFLVSLFMIYSVSHIYFKLINVVDIIPWSTYWWIFLYQISFLV